MIRLAMALVAVVFALTANAQPPAAAAGTSPKSAGTTATASTIAPKGGAETPTAGAATPKAGAKATDKKTGKKKKKKPYTPAPSQPTTTK